MKLLIGKILLIFLILTMTSIALAVIDTATQDITITFDEVAAVSVSGDPGTLIFTAPASPGDLPADQSDSSTTMSWTSNVGAAMTRKITGNIDALFNGVNLYVTVDDAGSNGTSAGETQFLAAATDYDFVTGITNEDVLGETITYRAQVSSMVVPYSNVTHTVTWTLTEDS